MGVQVVTNLGGTNEVLRTGEVTQRKGDHQCVVTQGGRKIMVGVMRGTRAKKLTSTSNKRASKGTR